MWRIISYNSVNMTDVFAMLLTLKSNILFCRIFGNYLINSTVTPNCFAF